MSSGRLRRFLHLERPRPTGAPADPADPPPTSGRFDGLSRPPAGPGPRPARSGAQLERFEPVPEPEIELADPPTGARRPFTRCMRCGAENGAFAVRCAGCDADLDTAAQRAFDERLWERREEERRRAEAALEERRRLAERSEAEEARARRELAETMAREVGEQERRRLDRGGWGGWGGGWGGGDGTPAALRLLRLVRNPWARIAVAVGAVAVPLVLLAVPSRETRQVGVVLLALLLAFLSPPGWRRRRWRRW